MQSFYGFEPEVFGLVDLCPITRSLLHKLCELLLVSSSAEIELNLNIHLYSKYEVYFKYTFGDILTFKDRKFMKIIEK